MLGNKTGHSQINKWTLGSETGLSWLKKWILVIELDLGS